MNLWQEMSPAGVAKSLLYRKGCGKGVPCTWPVTGENSEVSPLLGCTDCASRIVLLWWLSANCFVLPDHQVIFGLIRFHSLQVSEAS